MQGALDGREIGGGGRDRVEDLDAVTTTGAADASGDGDVASLLTAYLVVVCRGLGRFHTWGNGTGAANELNELEPAKGEPQVPSQARKICRPFEGVA
jgi:hypothetical protein